MSNNIQYLRHGQIDKTKWDSTIENSPNGFIYCRSFFLDAMCTWDALVLGDYDYVMPLPHKNKWGIQYIYTPFFIGQTGIISSLEISNQMVNCFLKAIPKHFSYIDLSLNEGNVLPEANECTNVLQRVNYILPLNQLYHLIENNYSKDAKKNLRQAAQYHLNFVEDIGLEKVVSFFKNAYGSLNEKISDDIFNSFIEAGNKAIQQGVGLTVGLTNAEGQLVSAAFLGKDTKRIYYICAAPNEAGRNANAQHVLIDELIRKYAGSNLLFDFEGSDIPAVATFYKKFSPEIKMYPRVKINRLPFWIRWLKK
ncbi:MAG TPA: hypothetical protein PK504_06775 [Ferruginibacter sp.]|nr:hypothetical protein [Ferruginibacter sp.]HRE64078.1 hypothetical protein [Ferruginibacter sp.]